VRVEVVALSRNIHNLLLHDVVSSPNKIRIIKEGKLRRAVHVARMKITKKACSASVGTRKVRRPLR
jgi:hypothetical protein